MQSDRYVRARAILNREWVPMQLAKEACALLVIHIRRDSQRGPRRSCDLDREE